MKKVQKAPVPEIIWASNVYANSRKTVFEGSENAVCNQMNDAGWDLKLHEKGLLWYCSEKHIIMHLSAAVSKISEMQKGMKE